MSIPTRITVVCRDGRSYEKKSFGTLSYGSDTTARSTWVDFFESNLEFISKESKDFTDKHCPWVNDWVLFYVPQADLIITRNDLGIPFFVENKD